MTLETWLLFCIAEIILCLSPGPAVIYVASQGLRSGFKPSLAASTGVVFGNTLYFLISAMGLGAVLLASHMVFTAIKWLGAAYLVFLGVRYILSSSSALQLDQKDNVAIRKIIRTGMLVQLSNPKNLVFFVAILPQFINPEASIAYQVLILGVSSQVIETLVLFFYGATASRLEHWVKRSGAIGMLDKISGGVLISVGASLIFLQR